MEIRTSLGTKNLIIAALFIALSFIGSYIKIFSTIAFDSLPGFLSAVLLGPAYGAAIGFLGHIFTALTSGFPLSLPMHLVIAFSMAITMLVFGLIFQRLTGKIQIKYNIIITGFAGVFFNGPVSLVMSMGALALMAGPEAAAGLLAMLPALLFASTVNIFICFVLYKPLRDIWEKIK